MRTRFASFRFVRMVIGLMVPIFLTVWPSLAAVNGVRVIIENRAPANGTWLTPFWMGFHDGTFDTYTQSQSASAELERMAEDGNSAPLSDLFSSSGAGHVQGVVAASDMVPPLAPGQTAEMTFILEGTDTTNRYLSFVSMVIPSNDAFIGNDNPTTHQIFDGSGNFLGAFFTIHGSDVMDAGTEVNDELPEHTAFFGQTVPNSGVDENGVVHTHPGYMPAGSGGILDSSLFAAADFTLPGYDMARITIIRSDTPVPAGDVSDVWDLDGSPYLLEGEVTVPDGQTLTIEPGVVIYSTSWYGIHVQGTLIAVGTETDSILFTGHPVGFPPRNPGWKGIRFENADAGCELAYCTMDNCKVTAGDAEAKGAGVYSLDSSPFIRNSTFRNGWAGNAGGAMYFDGGSPVITDNLITDNFIGYGASGIGAGICAVDATIQITGNVIRNNSIDAQGGFPGGNGTARGGGIYLASCTFTVSHNVIYENEAHATGTSTVHSTGSGIQISGGGGEIVNNTFVDNSCGINYPYSGGGAIGLLSGLVTIVENNIIVGSAGSGLWFGDYTSQDTARFNDFFDNDTNFVGDIPAGLETLDTVNGNGDPSDSYFNIYEDPLFANDASHDYHLTEGSPAIDAGNPQSPFNPDGTVADQGAFYFAQSAVGVPVAINDLVAYPDENGVLLTWSPVTTDTAGHPVTVTRYVIHASLFPQFEPSPDDSIGYTPGDQTQFLDGLVQGVARRFYVVVAANDL